MRYAIRLYSTHAFLTTDLLIARIRRYSWHGFRYIELTVPHGVTVDATSVECYPMRTDVEVIANFSSADPFLDQLRMLNRNTFDSNMMSVQSDCPHVP